MDGAASPRACARLRGRRVECFRDVVDRRLLGLAHVVTVLPVGCGHVLRQVHDEPAVLVDLRRSRLALQQGDGLTQVLQALLFEVLDGV